jgi:hypothetical protein
MECFLQLTLCKILQNWIYTWLSKSFYGNPTNVPLVSSLTQEPLNSLAPTKLQFKNQVHRCLRCWIPLWESTYCHVCSSHRPCYGDSIQ